MRPFRFGLQVARCSAGELRSQAQAAESAGFDVMHTWDHVADGWSPLTPLMAIADCTTHLRICPLVLNNDFHHPVTLAQELASLDHLSGGRLEVGIGAGHSFTEYRAIGQTFDPPAVRKARLAESTEILRSLLDGQCVTFAGEHYTLENVSTLRSRQDHVPILVGVNGKQALAHAARNVDIIGLTMLGRTLDDGQRHEVRWEAERLDDTVSFVREQAGARWEQLELNVLVQAVLVTDDRRSAAEEQARRSRGGLSVEDALTTPFLALGTHEEMAEHLLACRERWGISYFSVRDQSAFAPVIQKLRGDEETAVSAHSS